MGAHGALLFLLFSFGDFETIFLFELSSQLDDALQMNCLGQERCSFFPIHNHVTTPTAIVAHYSFSFNTQKGQLLLMSWCLVVGCLLSQHIDFQVQLL